jgi:hypothetical protein
MAHLNMNPGSWYIERRTFTESGRQTLHLSNLIFYADCIAIAVYGISSTLPKSKHSASMVPPGINMPQFVYENDA